ncbi:nitrite reductase small subunit NirD [Aquipuribacter sp. SD81]|uniref:nitrite reductase small subunit NirD n=1 Tax=Aquipuribacter sp. SD81 TaxID=3127703 RepID=UPI003015CF5F
MSTTIEHHVTMATEEDGWVDVCPLRRLLPERGDAALVGGVQVALFRLHDGTVRAVGNRDPFSGANVLARGIVGTRDGTDVVASPLYKQHFDLWTGVCQEDADARIPVHEVRVVDGRVLVRLAPDTRPGALPA